MKSALFLSAAALVLLGACSKSDTPTSREDNLRGTWKQTGGTVTAFYIPFDRDTTADYWKTAPKCYTDNTITFGDGYSGLASYGKEQCVATEPQTETMVWQVRSNDTILEVNNVGAYFYGANPMRGAIQELTANTLKIRYTVDTPATSAVRGPYVYVNTYTKQ